MNPQGNFSHLEQEDDAREGSGQGEHLTADTGQLNTGQLDGSKEVSSLELPFLIS